MLHHSMAKDAAGSIKGVCDYCGSPARLMGWQGRTQYWRMCTASKAHADWDEAFGKCKLPLLADAQKRIAAEPA